MILNKKPLEDMPANGFLFCANELLTSFFFFLLLTAQPDDRGISFCVIRTSIPVAPQQTMNRVSSIWISIREIPLLSTMNHAWAFYSSTICLYGPARLLYQLLQACRSNICL